MRTASIVSFLLFAPTICAAQTGISGIQKLPLSAPIPHMTVGPSHCDSSGTTYMRAYSPTNGDPYLARVSRSGKVLKSIWFVEPDIANHRIADATVDPAGATYVLINGRKHSSINILPIEPSGKHECAIEVSIPPSLGEFTASTIAYFASGRFLIFGINSVETGPKTMPRFIPLALVLDSSGHFISIVGGSINSQRSNPLWTGDTLQNMALEQKIALFQPYGSNSIDVIPPKKSNEIVEISDTGKIQNIIRIASPGPAWRATEFKISGERALVQYTQGKENDFRYYVYTLPEGAVSAKWSQRSAGLEGAGSPCLRSDGSVSLLSSKDIISFTPNPTRKLLSKR